MKLPKRNENLVSKKRTPESFCVIQERKKIKYLQGGDL